MPQTPPAEQAAATADPRDEVAPPPETAAPPPEDATASPETPPAPPPPASSHRRRLWIIRVLLVALLVPGLCLAAVEVVSPSVADAPARVAAIDEAHGSAPIDADPSWRVSEAIVAAEDAGFYSNHGIELPALARAIWGQVIGVDEGGSTITQQLAKVLYTSGDTSAVSRVVQVALALKLEGHYSKQAILSMYLSAIYFGHGYYGILAASEGYFGVTPDQLTWAQASLLAGLPQAPSLLDPLVNLDLATARQAYVLHRLVVTGVLTQQEANGASVAPLGLR
jgi:penicillin-binding protein 1A